MALCFTVGGTRGTFEPSLAEEVAVALDHAFGAEGEWEGTEPVHYGEQTDTGWADLQRKAADELGHEALPNLLALSSERGGVYLPAHVQAVSLPLAAGGPLQCASLPGLRTELSQLARHGSCHSTTKVCLNSLRWPRTPTTAGSRNHPRSSPSLVWPSPPTKPSAVTVRSGWSATGREALSRTAVRVSPTANSCNSLVNVPLFVKKARRVGLVLANLRCAGGPPRHSFPAEPESVRPRDWL